MDEWYLGRWATGSEKARWPDLAACFKEVFNAGKPGGEIYAPTEKILSLFDSLGFKSTFFFTGLVAGYYPDIVRRVASQGHEIACHNYHHLDYEYEPRDKFLQDLERSKKLLEDISGSPVIGYRSPNSSIPRTLVEDLEKMGFRYDSSVTPTRRLFGKFGAFTRAPQRPYHPSYDDLGAEGRAALWEFPWAAFPVLMLPAGSGIMHRIGGDLYNWSATHFSLRKGHTSYYFHPYEIDACVHVQRLENMDLRTRLFILRLGDSYITSLERFLKKHRRRLVSGAELLGLCNEGPAA